MSILGVLVRTLPAHLPALRTRLRQQPGLDIALDPDDGRLVVLIEDEDQDAINPLKAAAPGEPRVSAATVLGAIALWPEVLGTSLVYEYSGPDAPPPSDSDAVDYRSWRGSLGATSSTPRAADPALPGRP